MASKLNTIGKSIAVVMVVVFASCTKYGYIDGGLADGVHDDDVGIFSHRIVTMGFDDYHDRACRIEISFRRNRGV